MSVTFYGRTADGRPIMLGIEDRAFLNMSSANARAFLEFLGIDPGDEPMGEVTVPEARRAVMSARATFERRAAHFTRGASDTERPGKVRVVEGGIDVEYLGMRIDDFERFLGAVAKRGAVAISGGERRVSIELRCPHEAVACSARRARRNLVRVRGPHRSWEDQSRRIPCAHRLGCNVHRRLRRRPGLRPQLLHA